MREAELLGAIDELHGAVVTGAQMRGSLLADVNPVPPSKITMTEVGSVQTVTPGPDQADTAKAAAPPPQALGWGTSPPLLAGCVARGLRAPSPLVQLRLLRHRSVLAAADLPVYRRHPGGEHLHQRRPS